MIRMSRHVSVRVKSVRGPHCCRSFSSSVTRGPQSRRSSSVPARCEGAKDCVRACTARVFAMRRPDPGAPWFVKLKVAVHGGKQAYVADEAACTGCMKCVAVCPEHAIQVFPELAPGAAVP